MVPIQKVKEIVVKHDNLERELSSGSIDTKFFAKKSKEYAALKDIIEIAREFLKFESEKDGLEEILKDKSNEKDISNRSRKVSSNTN